MRRLQTERGSGAAGEGDIVEEVGEGKEGEGWKEINK